MNEYADWHDAAMGGPLEDDGGVSLEEQRQQLLQHRERDAVLCLVDCRKQMFEPYRHEAEKREPSAEAHGASVKEELNAPGAKDAKDAHGHTPFGDAMRCVRTLYQTKVLTSDQDLLGLVLYNTTTHDPIFDTAGVSMVQPFQQLGVEHIQAVDSLVAAGTPSSAAYRQFARQYGHQPSSALANALWIAQHHFMQLRSPMIKYRRIFVFTDDDDPSRGDEILKKHCAARVVDLHSAGVSLEVFGLGFGIDAESAAKEEGHTACADEENVLQRGGGASGTAYDAPGTYPGTEQLFRQDHFWSPLLEHSIPRDPNAQEHPIAGGLHLHARPEVFAELLSAVGHTVHAQRPVLHYALRLGMNPSGGSVPTMAVSLYTPLVAATPPASTWLDGATNDVLFSRARLVVEPSHVDGAAPATEILRRDVHHAVVVGGQRLIFTPAERQKMRMAVAEGSQPGLSILCFKRYTDVVKHKHASQRSSFIYPNLSAGGPESVRLFVLLHRTLLRQGKVAIAQHRLRPTTAPRLVALIPSPPASDAVEDTHGGAPLVVDPVYATFPAASLPAEGLGLYLMPLPYADDLRAVSAVLPPEHAERAVPSSEGLELMAGIIRNLSVPFDIAAVPNPSLNRLRQTLESLVLPDIPPSDDVGHYYSVNDDRDGFDVPPPMEPQFEDLTLPDREGMAKFAHVFNDFNNLVLGGTSYDADRLCASAAAARSTATTRARTAPVVKAESKKAKVEETDDDIVSVVGRCAASNDWHRLTIPQLKEYLKQVGKSLGGARKKDELIALAQDAHSAQ